MIARSNFLNGISSLKYSILSVAVVLTGYANADQFRISDEPTSSSLSYSQINESSQFSTVAYSSNDSTSEYIDIKASDSTDGDRPKPDRYLIKEGDTLWDLSKEFWGNSFFWPKLWSYNPAIPNAHILNKGDTLNFNPGSAVRPPSLSVESISNSSQGSGLGRFSSNNDSKVVIDKNDLGEERCTTVASIPFNKGSFLFRTEGFFREDNNKPHLGKIMQAFEDKDIYSAGDIVYIELDKSSDVQCGDILSIYEPLRENIPNPAKKKAFFGSTYKLLGELKILESSKIMTKAVITTSFEQVRKGSFLGKRIELQRSITTKGEASKKDVTGNLFEALRPSGSKLSTNDVVYIDKGEQDGVKVGDSFYILNQRQSMIDENLFGRKRKKALSMAPKINVVVGQLVITSTHNNVAEAIITSSSTDISLGSIVSTMIKGQ